MKLKELVMLPKLLHQAHFLLSLLLSPSAMPCALSEFRYSVTCWCFQVSYPHLPSSRQEQRGRSWPLAATCHRLRAVLMQRTFPMPSCSQDKKLLLSKEDSVQHPLMLSSPNQQHPSGKRGLSCSLDKGALACKRGVFNSSSDLWACRCWTDPCQLKKRHNFLLQKSPKVKKEGKSNIG